MSHPPGDLTGRKFGKLSPLSFVRRSEVQRSSLINGDTRSCGCERRRLGQLRGQSGRRHGQAGDGVAYLEAAEREASTPSLFDLLEFRPLDQEAAAE